MKLGLTVAALVALGAIGLWWYRSHLLAPVYLADVPTEAFRAKEERTVRNAFSPDSETRREILFDPPFSWQAICDDQPYCSTVIIQDRAWNLVGGGAGWREVSPDLAHLGMSGLVFDRPVYGRQIEDLGEGPEIAGEKTIRRAVIDENYGDRVADAIRDRDGSELIRRTEDGASLVVEVLHGRETGRLYEVEVLFVGPNMYDQTRVTFEYDVAIEIRPPQLDSASVASP